LKISLIERVLSAQQMKEILLYIKFRKVIGDKQKRFVFGPGLLIKLCHYHDMEGKVNQAAEKRAIGFNRWGSLFKINLILIE
jgi:hypothetical protein